MSTTGYNTQQFNATNSKFDFYSGSQITVWFGNILIDDINSIQWVRTQNKMPLYGYASQLFDGVADGIVMIQGTFTINFRQQGYLSAIMDSIKGLYNTLAPTDALSKTSFDKNSWPVIKQLIAGHLKNGTFGPKTIQDIQDLGNSPDFFDTVKLYEDVIWGDKQDLDPVTDGVDVSQSIDIPRGFNILISYGNPSHADTTTLADNMQSTTKSIVGVHLTGESQMIRVGGQPIQEQYSFIARNTDSFIGTSR